MAIWILIGVPLLLLVVNLAQTLNGSHAEHERRARDRWPLSDPTPEEWRQAQRDAEELMRAVAVRKAKG